MTDLPRRHRTDATEVADGTETVVELRQYTLHPGRRDELIDLFDRELVETQEATGMRVIGQFRDLDRPDHFVWLRGFPDMAARAASLAAFYGGPVWAAHRARANATMVDSDDVLLLRPVRSSKPFALPSPDERDRVAQRGVVAAIVHDRRVAGGHGRPEALDRLVAEIAGQDGTSLLGAYETEAAENTFPPLPVRSADVDVWFVAFDSVGRLDSAITEIVGVDPPAVVLRLTPTTRSLLGRAP